MVLMRFLRTVVSILLALVVVHREFQSKQVQTAARMEARLLSTEPLLGRRNTVSRVLFRRRELAEPH